MRSVQAGSLRQVEAERRRHGVQAVARHEGARAAGHALVQAQHQGPHAGGRGQGLRALQPRRQQRRAPRLRGRRRAVGPLGRRQPGTPL